MDFRFTEEQLMFRDSVRTFLKEQCTPAVIRASWTESARLKGLRTALAQLGLAGIVLPEDRGGLGLAEADAVLIAEECGAAAMPVPMAESAWVAAPLLAEASPELAARWLEKVIAGEATLALSHARNGSVDATLADLFLATDGASLRCVAASGASVEALESIDASKRPVRLKGDSGKAVSSRPEALERAFDRAALYAAADLLGASQRMLDIAVAYASERRQFGKPIGSFQAVKHLLADVQVKLTFARPVVYFAAYALAQGRQDASLRVSHAKVAANAAARLAARRALQVHGAIGYTWEYDLQIWMKRVWATMPMWGTSAWHRDRLAASILAPNSDLGPGRTWAA